MTTPSEDVSTDITAWVGRTERVEDPLSVTQAQAAAAMFDAGNVTPEDGGALPLLWHWFYFLPRAAQSALDVDGHPVRGGFMPPVTQPRRMFAGSRVRLYRPLRLGRPATREATIQDVALKSGRSGVLVFVTVQYRFLQDGVLCLDEEQDIVYRDPGAPVPPPHVRPWPDTPVDAMTREVHADSRLLFRFSALTFNAHRIHYDREYAMREEGYPGLVVHGPLTAMLLLQLAQAQERMRAEWSTRAMRAVTSFSFRGVAPLFDVAPFRLVGVQGHDGAMLEAQGPDGSTALKAEVTFGG